MISLALMGQNITHSRSPELYQRLWKDWPSCEKREESISYKILNYQKEDPPPNLEEIFTENDLLGLNITSPWKAAFQEQITYAQDFFGPLGIVNCVKRKNGMFWGTNTDCLAVRDLFVSLKEKVEQYVLFGDGAMAKVFLFIKALNDKKTPCHHYFRKNCSTMEHLDLKSFLPDKRTLLVNACDRSFVFKGLCPKETIFWDYNYDHPFHKERFETYIDGLSLLESQGRYALKFFLES